MELESVGSSLVPSPFIFSDRSDEGNRQKLSRLYDLLRPSIAFHAQENNKTFSISGSAVGVRQEALRGDDMRGMIHNAFGIFIQFMDNNISEREEIEPNVEDNTRHPSRNQPNPEVDKFEQLMKDSNEELYPGCKKFRCIT